MHRNRNPCNSFFMVNMASGMGDGRVGPTTTTTTNDVAQHQEAKYLIPSHAVLDYKSAGEGGETAQTVLNNAVNYGESGARKRR